MALYNSLLTILTVVQFVWCGLFGCNTAGDGVLPQPELDTATSAYERQVQAHSSTLYKVSVAIWAEDANLSNKAIAAAVQKQCAEPVVKSIKVDKKTFDYGWQNTPKDIKCFVTPDTQEQFKVKVITRDGRYSINGAPLR